ncbi:glycosyl transferase family 1 [Gracilaria domingensis]|nr:glycosyl transferase family 1 [Gracilaria domingensis]
MARIGFACRASHSYLNSMSEIALELQRRGHQIVFIGIPDIRPKLKHFEFELLHIGETDFPPGYAATSMKMLGELKGHAALRFVSEHIAENGRVFLQDAPELVRAANLDLLVIEQTIVSMMTIAEFLNIPYVTVCVSLISNPDPFVPPAFSHHTPHHPSLSKLQTFAEHRIEKLLNQTIFSDIHQTRKDWNLPPIRNPATYHSPYATIVQFPKSIDFKRKHLPTNYHYVGRFSDPSGTEPLCRNVPFPFHKLDGRPIIYASLGTILNEMQGLYRKVIESTKGLNAQLVVSLGNPQASVDEDVGDAIVVPFAPQEKLVSMSSIIITHGGNNTVTMAMSYGVPMVVIPIANDQPGVAARVAVGGLGVSIHPKRVNVDVLRSSIKDVLVDSRYREQAEKVRMEVEEAGGVRKAADIAEIVARTRRPAIAS